MEILKIINKEYFLKISRFHEERVGDLKGELASTLRILSKEETPFCQAIASTNGRLSQWM